MIIFLLLAIFIVSISWELYYKYKWSKNVDVKLWFETDAVYAGREIKLYEVIENKKSMPVPVLEVGFHTKRELDFADIENTNVSDYIYKRDIFAVLGRQKITREIPVKCTRRGKYTVSDADITTYSLLYRKHYSKDIETDAGIYVYPKMTDVSEIINMCERMFGTLQCSKRLYEDPFAFRTIRSYTTDDAMKTINWKASAKTGALMVNTFDSVQSSKAMVFLDVEDTGILKYVDLVEESIAIAATIIRKLIRQNMETGFTYNGLDDEKKCFDVIMPTNQKSRLINLERTLAEYDAENGTLDFCDCVEKTKLPTDDTLLIFITKNLNYDIFERLKKYVNDYQTLIVVPKYRGINNIDDDLIKSRNNVQVLIREVERA